MQFAFFILKIFKNLLLSTLKGNDADSRGEAWGLVLFVSMTQCIRKLICDSSLKSDNQIIPVILTFRPVQSFEIYCNNTILRGGSRNAATSKMEHFVIIVNGRKRLTIITKRSILKVAAVLDAPLIPALL